MATDENRDHHTPTAPRQGAKVITVEVRSVYGRDTIYPVDDAAVRFAEIAGTTTLTVHALRSIIALGYEVRYQQKRSIEVDAITGDWCNVCNARVDDQCACERGL